MKKRLKRLLNNKGMTLTELIVALFLTSVILAIAVGMLAPVKNLMNTVKSNAHMDTINSTVEEYIRGSVQNAKSLKFVVLNGNNTIKDGDTDGVKGFFSGNKVRALAILDTGVDETSYRMFDFGEIPAEGYTWLVNRLNDKDQAEYGVFNEPFYEGTSCAVEFYSTSGSRLQIASQCFKNGKMINQKHVLSFNLLNSNASGFSAMNEGDGVQTNVDIEAQTEIEGHCYLILYTLLEI